MFENFRFDGVHILNQHSVEVTEIVALGSVHLYVLILMVTFGFKIYLFDF